MMREMKLFKPEFIDDIAADAVWNEKEILNEIQKKKSTSVGDLFKHTWYLAYDKTSIIIALFTISWFSWKFKWKKDIVENVNNMLAGG